MTTNATWQSAPILGVSSVRQSAAYFVERLGFACDPKTGIFPRDGEADTEAVYALLERDGARIHLQIRRLPSRPGRRESIERDVYVYVDDVESLYRDLLGRGAEITHGPEEAQYGLREIEVVTPDGHRLTFGST
jgi:catechol 2,3-dioxygenase-like lactoylglutathione lyase family enzyme